MGPPAGIAAALAVAFAGAVALTPPKGNRRAIEYYTRQADAYASLPGVHLVETGFFTVRADGGTRVSYAWGRPPSGGYRAATATVDAMLLDGRIEAYLAVLRAPKTRAVRILMAGSSVFTSTTRCWRRSTASGSPFGTGERYVFNDGGAVFGPLVRHGRSTTTALAYRWSPGAHAAETDTFTGAAPAPFTVTVSVTGATRLTIRKSILPLAVTPSLPVAPPPAVPRPKPLCK
ncbi:MAG TPA: hypothetical protein VFA82_01895 [Gaiellaceae bacterium]|nr:hypothetical protein [Gaiellaceae bacterium]